jgi:hypothetical protein
VTRTIPYAELVALPSGGAMLLGIETQEHGDDVTSSMASEWWEPAGGAWHATTPLPRLRSSFASVALPDGRVLVAGGYNERDASYSSAYLFDPVDETWSKSLMAVARTHPGAALLPDGRVLVVGGYFYAPEPEPGAHANVTLAAWAPPTSMRPAAQVAAFHDVYVPPIGRALATAELFDPATGDWTRTGSMRYARSGPAITTLSDGRVLVVGSSDDNVRIDERAYRTAEIYDPATGRFASAGRLPDVDRAALRSLGVRVPEFPGLPGAVGRMAPLPDGGALLIGHQEWWKHQAEVVRSFRFRADGTWVATGAPYGWNGGESASADTGTVSRDGAVVGTLEDGSVLVAGGSIGGEASWEDGARPPTSVERYDPAADTWSTLPDMPDARFTPDGVTLADGSVLLAGGEVLVGTGEDMTARWTPETYRFVPAA